MLDFSTPKSCFSTILICFALKTWPWKVPGFQREWKRFGFLLLIFQVVCKTLSGSYYPANKKSPVIRVVDWSQKKDSNDETGSMRLKEAFLIKN